MRESGELAGEGHLQFFRGEITQTPGPLYYLVATPFRMTPWFLVGTLAMLAAALIPRTRPRLGLLALVAIPALIALSLASKQLDRYVLVVLPLATLAVGLGLEAIWTRARSHRGARVAAGAAGSAVLLALAHAAWVAPWGLAYFNPLLGGSEKAERTLLVGWGEGQELAGELIRRREAPDCDFDIVVSQYAIPSAFPCGSPRPDSPDIDRLEFGELEPDRDPDYAVTYIAGRQRHPDRAEAMRSSGRVVGVVRVRGIEYAEVIDLSE